MATDNIVKIKWNHFGVYRRFQFSLNNISDLFDELLSKIETVVPGFNGKLGWKDEEGDIIRFNTDGELRDALHFCNDNLLRIYTIENAKEKATSEAEKNKGLKEVHPFVTCDRCDQPVYGIRYKCAVCDDYDLCEECEKDGAHPDHAMIRYATPRTPRMDNPRSRRYWRHRPHGYRSSFLQEGIFGQTAAAAAHAAQQAASAAAQHAAQHAAAAAQHAAQHAAAAAAQFTENMNTTNGNAGTRPQFRESVAQGMEYLREVGTQIQQALANFGIEVDMDVRNSSASEESAKAKPVVSENDKKVPVEDKGDGKESETNVDSETKVENGKRKNDDLPVEKTERKADLDELNVPLKKMHISEHSPTEKQNLGESTNDTTASADDISGDWTMMDINTPSDNKCKTSRGVPLYPVIVDGKCVAGTPFIVPQPGPHNPHCYFIYPDEHIARCVEQLEEMGFDNCNGWLTRLAMDMKGDIGAVVENMKKDPIYAKHFESSS